jgi:aryl-phospho-beta-D-glucosidase BglC (GH1 family)
VQFHCLWGHVYNDVQRADVIAKMKAAGLTWVRIDISWRALETTNNSYNAGATAAVANCVNAASAPPGLQVLLVVADTPGWANGGQSGKVPPTNATDFRDFMQWATGQFAEVDAWQLYNEPNNTTYFLGDPATYVNNVLKPGYAGVKAVNPGDKVVTGGTTFYQGEVFVSQIYAAGAKGHFDAIGTQPYQPDASKHPEYVGGTESWWYPNNPPAIWSVMATHGDTGKEIWITEFGYSEHTNEMIPPGSDHAWALGVTAAQQADFAVRAIRYARTNWPYVGPFFWYKERSYPLNCCGYTPAWFDMHVQNHGLLHENGSPRPVYTRLQQYLTTGT